MLLHPLVPAPAVVVASSAPVARGIISRHPGEVLTHCVNHFVWMTTSSGGFPTPRYYSPGEYRGHTHSVPSTQAPHSSGADIEISSCGELFTTQEDPMKTPWHVRRGTVAQPDGERRWDEAYQFLLRWTMEQDR